MSLSAFANRSGPLVRVDDLLADVHRVGDVQLDAMPALLSEIAARHAHLAAVQAALAARLLTEAGSRGDDDRLLTVDEAAAVLSQTTDWLYRHARELPFTVRVGNLLRFSTHGIQTFIKNRRGRS